MAPESTHTLSIYQPPRAAAPHVQAEVLLRQSAYPELWLISCSNEEGALTLHGTVSTYYLKQLAQTIAQGLSGVDAIENRLHVRRRS